MPPRSLLVVHLSLLATAAIWGSNSSAIKYLLDGLRPADILAVRTGGGALIFALILVLQRSDRTRVAGADLVRLLLLGVLGITVVNTAFVYGQDLIPAATSSLIVTSNPIHTAIFSSLLGIERMTGRKVAGIALAMAGFAVIVLLGSGNGSALGGGHTRGILIVAIGPLCWAAYTVLSKPLVGRYGPTATAAYTAIGGAIGLIPVVLAEEGTVGRLSDLGAQGWAVAAYTAVFGLVVAYTLWYRGLAVLSPSQTAVYIYLVPLFGLLFAWWLLDEQVTRWLILGGATILAGVILTNSGRRTSTVDGASARGGAVAPTAVAPNIAAPGHAGAGTPAPMARRAFGRRAGGR